MGMEDQLLGELTKKFGIGGDQAKAALEKMLPFVKGKLPFGGGGEVGLLSQIKRAPDHDHLAHVPQAEKDEHAAEVSKASGLSIDTVKQMLPEVAKFLGR
jgi:hypothetical protein